MTIDLTSSTPPPVLRRVRPRNVLGAAALLLLAGVGAACSLRAEPEAAPSDPAAEPAAARAAAVATDGTARIMRMRAKGAPSPSDTSPVVGLGCNYPANLTTHGGGSLATSMSTLTPIDWGPNVDQTAIASARTMYESMSTSQTPYISWLQQEYGIPSVQPGGHYVITPANTATSLTEPQIAAELQHQVAIGVLEALPNLLYIVHLPPGVVVMDPTGTTQLSCPSTPTMGAFCAYHNYTTYNGQRLYYAVVPDFASSPCATECFEDSNTTWQQALQTVESHEIIEALTDPDQTGWQDLSEPCGSEIGDICNGLHTHIDGESGTVTVQKMWSNLAQDCVTGDKTPTIQTITPQSGPSTGGTKLTVTGDRFVPGATTFSFGSAPAASVSCSDAHTCTVYTPQWGSAGVIALTATANGNASAWDGPWDNFTFTCTPATCAAGACGSFSDGCGGTIQCGCNSGQVCEASTSTCCTPKSASAACGTATCGTASDGCGGTVTCGPACGPHCNYPMQWCTCTNMCMSISTCARNCS